MIFKSEIMDKAAISRAIKRIAHQIIEQNKGLDNLYVVGIRSRGVPMAERLVNYLNEIEGTDIKCGILDITLYRDDLTTISHQPVMKGSEIEIDVKDKKIVLVDDVLYTGRTVRAAIDGILDFGRPKEIQLCVLIDRGHRELPIKSNFVGKNVPTAQNEVIKVKFVETDEKDAVEIYTK